MGLLDVDEDGEDVDSPMAILAASSSVERTWAPIVMLGPVLPSMLAVVTIVLGDFIVKVYRLPLESKLEVFVD